MLWARGKYISEWERAELGEGAKLSVRLEGVFWSLWQNSGKLAKWSCTNSLLYKSNSLFFFSSFFLAKFKISQLCNGIRLQSIKLSLP